jgi:hypothetical protein
MLQQSYKVSLRPVACTINIYDLRFYNRNDIGLYFKTRDDRKLTILALDSIVNYDRQSDAPIWSVTSSGINYDHNKFIIQATIDNVINKQP